MGAYAFDADNGANKAKGTGFAEAFSHHPDHDGCSGITAQFVDSGVEVHVDGGFVTDANDTVFGA